MTPRQRRLWAMVAGVAAFGIALGLVLNTFQSNLVFFFSPSQIAAKEAPQERPFRLGGMVEAGSVKRAGDGLTVEFIITDTATRIPVSYRGILPDLFREGKGVVAQGRIGADGIFRADEVLAKHDENYMPPESAEAIAKAKHGKLPEKGAQAPATAGGGSANR